MREKIKTRRKKTTKITTTLKPYEECIKAAKHKKMKRKRKRKKH